MNVYALLDPGATFSFVTPLVAKKFHVLLDVFFETFFVITKVGYFVIARRIFRSCPISFPNKVTWVNW